MAAVTPSLYQYALLDLAASAADSVAGGVASVAEIAASEEVSIEVHEADLAVVTAVLVVPPTATEARQTHRVDLAMAEAGTAADLTATAETMEEAVVAVATVVAMTTDLAAVAAVAAVGTEVLTDLGLAATRNRLAPVTAAAAVVGIATATMTGETTPGSALMKVVQAMKENESFAGINRNKARPSLVLRWVSCVHSFRFFSSCLLSPLRQQG